MRFVAAHTDIPIPRVWFTCRLPWDGDIGIFMSRIVGSDVSKWETLTVDDKQVIVDQLARYMTQLRSIPPPPGAAICSSVTGKPIQCHRLNFCEPSGPFRDEEQMNLQLRMLLPIDDESFPPKVSLVHSRSHPVVFTHNDIAPRNIMFDGKKVTLIDWECAGWFPAHWEYCKAVNWCYIDHADWLEWAPKCIPVYEEEAEVDKLLLRRFRFQSTHAP